MLFIVKAVVTPTERAKTARAGSKRTAAKGWETR